MTGRYPMTMARNANPIPASMTVSALASVVRGTTSPRPSVKNVVPLRYRSAPKLGAPPARISAEPAAHWTMPKAKTMPTAQRLRRASSESGPNTLRKASRRFAGRSRAVARHGSHVPR
jgi:hypothetical protein